MVKVNLKYEKEDIECELKATKIVFSGEGAKYSWTLEDDKGREIEIGVSESAFFEKAEEFSKEQFDTLCGIIKERYCK